MPLFNIMPFKKNIKFPLLIALVFTGLSIHVSAQITARERFNLLPYLIPEDPGNLLIDILPEVNRYPLAEANSIYVSKKDNPLVVNQSWQDLAINYLLHGQYERSLECLQEAQADFTEDLVDFKIVQGYALAKLGRWAASNREWLALDVLLEDNYVPELHLFGNAVKQYKFSESTEILDTIISEADKMDSLLHHYSGIRHFQEGDLHQARVSFIKAINPAAPNPWALLGMSLLSLTESESYDAIGWLQRAVENSNIAFQRSIIEIPAYSKIHRHPDFMRIKQSIAASTYTPPNPALEESLSYRYSQKFALALLLEGGLKLRMFEPKEKVWTMK